MAGCANSRTAGSRLRSEHAPRVPLTAWGRRTAFDLRGPGRSRPADGGVRSAGPRGGVPHTEDYAASDITPKWGGDWSRG